MTLLCRVTLLWVAAACHDTGRPTSAAGHATVALHVVSDPERPIIVYLRDGGAPMQVCERAPCDVMVERGKKVTFEAGISGAAGSIEVTADKDQDVVIPLHPAGLPPRPQPRPEPIPATPSR
jgi:hypothetical protein